MNTRPLVEPLIENWRGDAETLKTRGAHRLADMLHGIADELEDHAQRWEREPLTLQQAADESGYTVAHLGRLVREEAIPNAGRPGSPRIERRHLPKKPGGLSDQPDEQHISRTKDQIVRSVAK